MKRDEKTNSILRQFRKKSKQIVNKDVFTEFFYLNRNRSAIEFLSNGKSTLIEDFLGKFLPEDFKSFVKIKILNDSEEEISTWFYNTENLVIVLKINWGFKKQEISIDIDADNFFVSAINEDGVVVKDIEPKLLNEYLISFLTLKAKTLSQAFRKLK